MSVVTLLNADVRLCPEATRGNLYYSFYVPEGVSRLRIRYRYEPKYLADETLTDRLIEEGFRRYVLPEDREAMKGLREEARPLVNLVTLSLDSPNGYAGAAHRQANEQEHIIGGEGTSPGFDPADIVPGLWRLCVSVHTVVTKECAVSIRVEAEEL